MITICIDCGASFIKGARFENGVMMECKQMPAPGIQSMDSIFKPEKIMLLTDTVREIFCSLLCDDNVDLCISNEMHGFVLVDENGVPYTDYVSWQMEYGAMEVDGTTTAQLLRGREYKKNIEYSGMPIRAGLPTANLFYFAMTGRLKGKKLYFYTLGDYIIRMLSGMEPICHPTNAAATGMYHIFCDEWNHDLIERIGAKDIVFPDVGNKSLKFSVNGVTVRCFPAIGDQQAALLGAGIIQKDMLSFNLGTGAQTSVLTDSPEIYESCQCRPYFYGYYLKTIPHIPSGRALNVFYRLIESVLKEYHVEVSEEVIWGKIREMSDHGKSAGLQIDLSFFENAVSDHVSGTVRGINEKNFIAGNIIYAVFEQMADNCVNLANKILDGSSPVQSIVFSGGVARRFPIVRELIAAHFPEMKCRVAENDTMQGLYRYAAMI